MYLSLESTIFLISHLLSIAASETIQKAHSLIGPFTAGNAYLSYWDLTGSSETHFDFIRLTSDEPGKRGAIWNNYLNDVHDWELQMHFHIHGKGTNLNGDGMAIWYARESLHLGPVFGSKDYFAGLAVYIDTYKNFDGDKENKLNFPHVAVMVNNGTLHYNSAQDGRYSNIGGCHANLRNLEKPAKIAVSYIKEVLMVFLDAEGLGVWNLCFRSPGIHLPTGYYFGVSASTGELSDNHDIYLINVLDMDPPDMEKKDTSEIIPEAEYFVLPKDWEEITKGERIHRSHVETFSLSVILESAAYAGIFNVILILLTFFVLTN